MRSTLFAVMFASTLFAGCAMQTDAEDDGNVAGSEDELTKTQIVGTWIADTGPIYEITFTKDYAETLGGFLKGRQFSAEVDNGIRCITTPCDSSDSVGGVYKLSNSGKTVTLASYDKPSLTFSKYLGDYASSINSKGILTLTKKDGTVAGTFHKQTGVKCGTNVCGAGTYCCNPVMSICAKTGMVCIQ